LFQHVKVILSLWMTKSFVLYAFLATFCSYEMCGLVVSLVILFYRQMFSLMVRKIMVLMPLKYLFAASSEAYRAYNITDHNGCLKCARTHGACHVWWEPHCPYLPYCSWTAICEYSFTLSIHFETFWFVEQVSETEQCYHACKGMAFSV
jgi:hypothetical protein